MKHVPGINKQSLKFPGEWHKNIHSVLNNVLLDNNIKSYTVLFRFSDMLPPNWWRWGYMYPQMKKNLCACWSFKIP